MLKCKNCGEKLTKFNKEICPYCGCQKPLSESIAETDTTKAVSYVKEEEIKINQKSFKTFLLLTYFLGLFGVEYVYLNKIKEFIFTLIANLAIYICVFFICFACKMDVWAIILIPFIILYILSIGYGLFLTSKKAVVKDNNGVPLK